MRKIIFGGANSLDNTFARKDGGVDLVAVQRRSHGSDAAFLFFEMSQQIDLKLLKGKPFKNGCVLARYGVKHP